MHTPIIIVTKTKEYSDFASCMAPFHQFECTEIDDQYVVDTDVTAEEFKIYSNAMIDVLISPTGDKYWKNDKRFYRPVLPGEKSRSTRLVENENGKLVESVYNPPGDYIFEEIPWKQYGTFKDYLEFGWSYDFPFVNFGELPNTEGIHKFGYTLLSNTGEVLKVVRRTNPNAFWDWWVVGGRWSGLLHPTYDPWKDPRNQEPCRHCKPGRTRKDCQHCGGSGIGAKWVREFVEEPGSNTVLRHQLPLEELSARRRNDMLALWDRFEKTYQLSSVFSSDLDLESVYKKISDMMRRFVQEEDANLANSRWFAWEEWRNYFQRNNWIDPGNKDVLQRLEQVIGRWPMDVPHQFISKKDFLDTLHPLACISKFILPGGEVVDIDVEPFDPLHGHDSRLAAIAKIKETLSRIPDYYYMTVVDIHY